MKIEKLTQEIVKELLDYDPETGILIWKKRDYKWFDSEKRCIYWNSRFSNKEAGSINGSGRWNVRRFLFSSQNYLSLDGRKLA